MELSKSLKISDLDLDNQFPNDNEDGVVNDESSGSEDEGGPVLKRPRIECLIAMEAVNEIVFRLKSENQDNDMENTTIYTLDSQRHIIYKAVADVLVRKPYLKTLTDFLLLKIKYLWENEELLKAVMNLSEEISEEIGADKVKDFVTGITNSIHKEGKFDFLYFLMTVLKSKSNEFDTQCVTMPFLHKQLLEDFGPAMSKYGELIQLKASDNPELIQEEMQNIKLQLKFIISKTFVLEKSLESATLKTIAYETCYALTRARGDLNRSCNDIEAAIQQYKTQFEGLGYLSLYKESTKNLQYIYMLIYKAHDYLKNIKDKKATDFIERHFLTLFPQLNDLYSRIRRLYKYLLQVAIFKRKLEFL